MKRSGFATKALIGAIALASVGAAVWWGRGEAPEEYLTFTARRGPLDVLVIEGGNIEALESQEIKSEVKGWQGTKILSIVDEGTYVTEEDVKNKKVLVELDASELREKLTTSEIEFRGTQASLTEAEKSYDIQRNQSESDIYAAELEVNFARMELQKYLGAEVTGIVMAALDEIERQQAAEEAAAAAEAAVKEAAVKEAAEAEAAEAREAESEALETPLIESAEADREWPEDAKEVAVVAGAPADPTPETEASEQDSGIPEEQPEVTLEDLRLEHPDVDFSDYAREESSRLGNGEAAQNLRKLEDALMVAEQDYAKSQTDYDGKKRLFERDFITMTELEAAQIETRKQEASVKAAETARMLFIEYEFPKQAQKLLADYIQAERKLDRTEQEALSKIAQASAKLLSAQARFKIERERIKEYQDQIDKCVMVAERAGLVVYGGSGPRYWNEEPIKAGATVREKQAIITIPDTTKMAVRTNIHEADIKRVKVGHKASIRVDAFADRRLSGEVVKVAVLPDSENRWMNPDLKVYETKVKIDGAYEWLKPGMSAEVEILVEQLEDVVYIPIQSVVPQGNKRICFVIENGEPVRREVETGETTVEFIVVTKGLEAGEPVLVRPPEGSREEDSDDEIPGDSAPEAPADDHELTKSDSPSDVNG